MRDDVSSEVSFHEYSKKARDDNSSEVSIREGKKNEYNKKSKYFSTELNVKDKTTQTLSEITTSDINDLNIENKNKPECDAEDNDCGESSLFSKASSQVSQLRHRKTSIP